MSNLLKDASILLTPTGYDNGSMNAIKPEVAFGEELSTNGDFSNGTTGWSNGSSTLSVVDGKLKILATGSFSYARQNITVVSGKKYKISVNFFYNSLAGNIETFDGTTNTISEQLSKDGVITLYVTPNSTNLRLTLLNRSGGSGDFNYWDNVSVVEDLSGDFQFERNSAATRVNAQGLVENVQIISPELVSNGNFSQIGTEEVLNGNFSQIGSELITNGDFSVNGTINTGSYALGWSSPDSGLSISNGKLIITNGASVGGRAYGTNGVNSISFLTSGKSYKLVYTITENNDNALVLYHNGGAYVSAPNTVGTHTIYYKADGAIFILRNNTANTTIKIDNVSVKEVGQNWTLGTGWSIGDDKVLHTGTQSLIGQSNILTIGKTYKITFDLSGADGSNYARLLTSQYPNGGNYTSDGTITVYTSTLISYLYIYGVGDVSITNISVKEVGQDWSLGTGWSVDQANGKAVFDSGADSAIQQSSVLTSGLKYKLSIDVLDRTTGSLQVRFGNTGSVDETISANGTFTYILISDGTSLYFRATGGFDGSITNISVKEITDDTNIPRINYEGFSYQDSLGSEEIVNGDFATDSDWAKNNGATISGGKGNIIGDGSSFTNLLQANVFTIGKKYKVTVDVTINSGLGLKFQDGATNSNFGTATTSGSYTFYGVANNSNLVIGRKTGGTAFDSSIDNVSVKEYLGQEVVPDSGCGSWLLEPQSTNLVTYSEDFSQWNATGSTTIESGYLAPDGTLNAYKVSGSGSTLQFDNITNQTDTRTIYARTISGSGLLHLCSFNGNTNNLFTITEQWQRFEVNGAISTGASTFYAVDFRGSSTLTEVILWGGQAEALSYATSYIPTNGATNTRLQDIANNSGNSSLINSTEGVLYADIAALANDGVPRKISLSDGDGNPQIALGYDAVSNQIRAIVFDGTFPVDVVLSTTNYDVLEYHKVAIKYKSGDSSLWVDGTEVQTSTNAFTITSALNNLNFDDGSGSSDFFGKNKALAVYKEALTDANLRCLTYPNPVATTFDLDFDTIAEQFTFTRGSEATFVNSQGLIESTNQLGPELVTNGDFATDSNWVKQTGWSIANGVATCDGTNLTQLYQTNVLTQNKLYKVTYSITSRTSGGVFAKLGDNILGAINSTVGTYTEYFNFTQANLSFHFRSSNFIGSIDNVSVKEVITATNTPRIDYSTGEKAFLLEPQSTNLYPYSQTVTSGGLTFFTGGSATATLTNNYSISPDGTQNALRFQATVLNNISSRAAVRNLLSTSAVMSTVSVYAKSNTNENYTMIFHYEGGVRDTFVVTPEWQRFSFSEVSAVTNNVGVELRGTYTSLEADVSLWGFQFENQSYATSLIPTSGASATRNQELCNNATPVINSEEGVLYVDAAYLNDTGSYRKISINDGTNSNQVTIEDRPVSNQVKAFVAVGGGSSMAITTTLTDVKSFNKMALKWKQNNFSFWVNGTKVHEDLSGASFSSGVLNKLSFAVGNSNNFIGNTKGLKVYPKALADVQLEALTSFGSFTEMANALNYTII